MIAGGHQLGNNWRLMVWILLGDWSLTLINPVKVGGLVGVKQLVCMDVGSFRYVLKLIDPVCNVFNLVKMGICFVNQVALISLYWR